MLVVVIDYPVNSCPISPSKSLIIPKRHIGSFFEASIEEREELLSLLDKARQKLIEELNVAAFNIGINDGVAVGCTIAHLHVHLIPRFTNDQSTPLV